jgi:hypothetical protein
MLSVLTNYQLAVYLLAKLLLWCKKELALAGASVAPAKK